MDEHIFHRCGIENPHELDGLGHGPELHSHCPFEDHVSEPMGGQPLDVVRPDHDDHPSGNAASLHLLQTCFRVALGAWD